MDEVSAGVIAERDKRYLIVKNFRNEWGFPKGHVEDGESKRDAALRECLEETGMKVSITEDRPRIIEYPMKKGGVKRVYYFPAEYESGSFIKNREIENV